MSGIQFGLGFSLTTNIFSGSSFTDVASILNGSGYWYDSADISTITTNGSNQSTQWRSKAANNTLRQTAGSTAPLTGEMLNGEHAMDFRTDRYMIPDLNLFPASAPCEVFFVGWSDRTNFTDNTFGVWTGSGSGYARVIQPIRAQFGTATIAATGLKGPNTHRSLAILHAYVNGYAGTTTQYVTSNDRGFTTGSTTINGLGASSAVGASNVGANPYNGLIAEIIIAHKTLTSDQRTWILNYLKTKWRKVSPVVKWHIVGIAGQSNNRGAWGPINRVEDIPDSRIAQLARTYNSTTGVVIENSSGAITIAEHPLQNRWRDTATPPTEDSVGPGMAYAKALLATLPTDEGVLLVPCAHGGAYIMPQPPMSNDITWHPTPTGGRSNAPYTDFVARMNRMITELGVSAELHSIIWHQGESEAAQATMSQATHATNLNAVLSGFRSSITGAAYVPIILGELGTFLSAGTYPNATNVNAAIIDTPNRLLHTAVASSSGLTDGGDGLHFNAASARLLGELYYTTYESSHVAAPIITGVVTVSGSTIEGQTLTATAPSYTRSGVETWQWLRDGSPISGATSASYLISSEDIGSTLEAQFTITNADGSDSVTSSPTSTIQDVIIEAFSSGLDGFWLDASASSRLYVAPGALNVLSITPALNGNTVGLALDQHLSIYNGSNTSLTDVLASQTNIIVNGDFANNLANWKNSSIGTGTVDASSGAAVLSGGAIANGNRAIILSSPTQVVGAFYYGSWAASVTSGSYTVAIGAMGQISRALGGDEGVFASTTTGASSVNIQTAANGSVIIADNFVLKSVPGNHAFQSTAGARPTYQVGPVLRSILDDNLLSRCKPATTNTIFYLGKLNAASDMLLGAKDATNGNIFIGTDSSGRLAAGIGSDGVATIHGINDIRNIRDCYALRNDGTTVDLWEGLTKVYSGPQSGSPTTTVPFRIMALNDNGTAAAFLDGEGSVWLIFCTALADWQVTAIIKKLRSRI